MSEEWPRWALLGRSWCPVTAYRFDSPNDVWSLNLMEPGHVFWQRVGASESYAKCKASPYVRFVDKEYCELAILKHLIVAEG